MCVSTWMCVGARGRHWCLPQLLSTLSVEVSALTDPELSASAGLASPLALGICCFSGVLVVQVATAAHMVCTYVGDPLA